eukprot:jgi/Ulvmu1/2129/UM127_0014.1
MYIANFAFAFLILALTTPANGLDGNCTDCCRIFEECVCGTCVDTFIDSAPPPCRPGLSGADASCCGNLGNECTLCNTECCLGDDVCSCRGTCIGPGEDAPDCGGRDAKRSCCDGAAAVARCNGERPPAPCKRDCCAEGTTCDSCGACLTDGVLGRECINPPGAQVSCCDNDYNECTRCNNECCLGSDVCTCKGTCIEEGEDMPECGPDEYFEGQPLKNCCQGDAGTDRCAVLPPEPPAADCEPDCCPEGMFCSGCGQCEPDGTQPPLCGFPPGVQVSCCDDLENPCTRCNEDCCLGLDVCTCKGTCVEAGEDLPECGPDEYFDDRPLKNCCQDEAGAERCAVISAPGKAPASASKKRA